MPFGICDCRSLSESYASIASSINTNPHYVSSSQIRKNKENRCFANVNCQRKWWFSVEDRGFSSKWAQTRSVAAEVRATRELAHNGDPHN